MKTTIISMLAIIMLSLMSCEKEIPDNLAPKIFLYGHGKVILTSEQTDTTILLFTKYTDPGAGAEDNLTKSEDIIITNDLENKLSVNSAGYINRAQTYTITYTAKDEANNTANIKRNIIVKNISDPFAGIYLTARNAQQIVTDTIYNSTVSADTRTPGRIVFPKVYAHSNNDEKIYFKLVSDLYSSSNSAEFSETIAYMGKSSNKETPFFENMSFVEAKEQLVNFDRLMIHAQTFTDILGEKYTISGVADPTNPELPYSRIEYIGNSYTIAKIYLELNVTKDGVYTDRVTETYTPQ